MIQCKLSFSEEECLDFSSLKFTAHNLGKQIFGNIGILHSLFLNKGQGVHGTGSSRDWEYRGLGVQGTGSSRDWELKGQCVHGTGSSRYWEFKVLGVQGTGSTGVWEDRGLGV